MDDIKKNSGTIKKSGNSKRKLVITIDVEAFQTRQSTNYIDRLIWGRFGNEEVGIGRMMEIADRYGHKLTFFVDYCEIFLYPRAFETISQEIVDRGHDLQLHAHPDLLPDVFWEKRGLKQWKTSLSGYTKERAEILMDFLLNSVLKVQKKSPVAFRGGGFRFNHEILKAMKSCGINLSFNYNIKSLHQPNNEQNLPMFKWDNGMFEIPVGALYYLDFLRTFDLNNLDFNNTAMIHGYMDKYDSEFGLNSILVMLMHSWSFCSRNIETGYYEYRDDKLMRSFDNFLVALSIGDL